MKRLTLIALLSLLAVFTHGQQLSPWGKSFWVSFMPVNTSTTTTITLLITSEVATDIEIVNPINNYYKTETTLAATTFKVEIPINVATTVNPGVIDRAIRIKATSPVRIMAVQTSQEMGVEATPILPENFAGRKFAVVSAPGYGNGRSTAMVVPTQNNTLVKITPSVDVNIGTKVLLKGQIDFIELDKGEVFRFEADVAGADISGTMIEVAQPGKKVIVYSGATRARLPDTCGNQSNIVEQLLPAELAGLRYMVNPNATGSYDILKIVPLEDNTTINIDGTNKGTFNKGSTLTTTYNSATLITADKPIVTAVLTISKGCSGSDGAPTITCVAPWEISAVKTHVTIPEFTSSNITSNYVSIITTTPGVYSTKVNGTPIFPNQFSKLPADTTFSIVYLQLNPGVYEINAFYGASVFTFGFGGGDAYSMMNVGNFKKDVDNINSKLSTEFWSSFHWDILENRTIDTLEVSYIITSPTNCKGKIFNPRMGWFDDFEVQANKPTEVFVPAQYAIPTKPGISDAAICIKTDAPCQVYAQIREKGGIGTAITNLIPASNFTDEYFFSTSDTAGSNMLLVATEDNTVLEIRPRQSTVLKPPIQLELDRGQVYLYNDSVAKIDITGSSIKVFGSCKKVAAFGGSASDNPGCKNTYTIQQLRSPLRYDKKFIVPYVEPSSRVDLKLTSFYDGTSGEFLNDTSTGTSYFMQRHFYQSYDFFDSKGYMALESDTPVMLNLKMSGNKCGPSNGYPAFMEVYGVNYMLNYAGFKLFNYADSGYLNIVTKTQGVSLLKLNGSAVNASLFNVVPVDTAYSYAKIKLPAGDYYLESDSGFTAFVYSFGSDDGYAYSLGYDHQKKLNYTVTVKGQKIANVPELPSGTFDQEDNILKICGNSGTVKIVADFTPDFWYTERNGSTKLFPGSVDEFNIGFNGPGVQFLKLTPQCSEDTFSSTVRNYGFPVVDAGNDTTVCPFDTVPLQATGGVKYWWWNNRSVNDSSLSNPYTIGKYDNILGVFITDTNNCTNFDLVHIDVVDSALVLPYFKDTIMCIGDSVLIGAVGGEGDPSRYTYYWDHGLGGGSEHMVNPIKTTTYRVIGIYPCGNLEPDTAYITVVVRDSLKLELALSDTSICEGDTIFAAALPAGGLANGYTYQWMAKTSGDSMQYYVPDRSTTIWAVLRDGCTALEDTGYADIHVIRKDEKLSVSITGDTLLCKGEKAFVKALGEGGRPSSYTYEWNFGLPPYQQHYINTTSPMTVRVTLRDECTDGSATAQATIQFRKPLSINQPSDLKLCSGDAKTVKVIGGGSDTSFYKYTWSHGLGEGDEKLIQGTQSKTITISLEDDCGDKVETFFDLIVQNNPIANFDVSDTEICEDEVVTFKDLSVIREVGTNYLWTFGDGNTSTDENPSNQYSGIQTFDVSLKLISPTGCKDSITKPAFVETVDKPQAGFYPTPDSTDIRTPQITLINTSVGGFNYSWSFGDGNTSTDINPVHAYGDTGRYTIWQIVDNGIGCSDSASSMVVIDDYYAFYIPNAFSPNGNNLNEVFKPEVRGVIRYRFMIYNRWGELVFKTDDRTKGWDGTYHGKPAQQGAYVYIVYLTGHDRKQQIYKGTFILLR